MIHFERCLCFSSRLNLSFPSSYSSPKYRRPSWVSSVGSNTETDNTSGAKLQDLIIDKITGNSFIASVDVHVVSTEFLTNNPNDKDFISILVAFALANGNALVLSNQPNDLKALSSPSSPMKTPGLSSLTQSLLSSSATKTLFSHQVSKESGLIYCKIFPSMNSSSNLPDNETPLYIMFASANGYCYFYSMKTWKLVLMYNMSGFDEITAVKFCPFSFKLLVYDAAIDMLRVYTAGDLRTISNLSPIKVKKLTDAKLIEEFCEVSIKDDLVGSTCSDDSMKLSFIHEVPPPSKTFSTNDDDSSCILLLGMLGGAIFIVDVTFGYPIVQFQIDGCFSSPVLCCEYFQNTSQLMAASMQKIILLDLKHYPEFRPIIQLPFNQPNPITCAIGLSCPVVSPGPGQGVATLSMADDSQAINSKVQHQNQPALQQQIIFAQHDSHIIHTCDLSNAIVNGYKYNLSPKDSGSGDSSETGSSSSTERSYPIDNIALSSDNRVLVALLGHSPLANEQNSKSSTYQPKLLIWHCT